MILTEEKLDVTTSNLPNKTLEFRVKITSKAFKDLYAGRYSKKIQAVIREICTNANDANLEAGCGDKPFFVHLPNKLEPWFSVRDDGPGLSEDRLVNTYTVCYESTRSSEHKYTGGFGLGSKTPFAIVDSFMVKNRYNGTLYSYNLYINSEGIPTLTCLSEEETTEGNGLEVVLNVEDKDFNEFYEEAKNVLSVFPIPPIITGHKIDLSKPKYFESTNEFGVTGNRQSRIIMNCVAYPIPRYFSELTDYGCDFYVPAGSFNPVTSREAIDLDNKARATLNTLVKKVNDYYTDKFSKEMIACPNLWAAMNLQYKLQDEFPFLALNLKWNNNPVPTKIDIERFSYIDGKYAERSKNLIFPLNNGRRKKKHQTKIRPSKRQKILVLDDGSINYLPSRFDNYCRQNSLDGYFVVNPDPAELAELGLDTIILDPKNLPLHVPSPRGPSTNKALAKADFYELTSGNSVFESWDEADFSAGIPTNAVFVYLTGFSWTLEDGRKRSTEDAKRVQDCLEKLFGIEVPIYAVRAAGLKKVPAGWVRLEHYVDIVLDKYKDLGEHLKYNFGDYGIDDDVIRNGEALDIPGLKAFNKKWKAAKANKEKVRSWEKLCEFKLKAKVKQFGLVNFGKIQSASIKGFPLVEQVISSTLDRKTLEELKIYVRLKRQGAFRVVADEVKQVEALPVAF